MHPSRKFTDQQEQKIAKRYLDGESQRTLAKSLVVSRTCIKSLLRRQKVKERNDAERNRKYQVNAHKFDVIDCEWKAYFLGLLYADGCVYKRSLSFSQKWNDGILVERLKAFLESEHPIKRVDKLYQGKRYPQSTLFVTERRLAQRLKDLGIVPNRPAPRLAITKIQPRLYHHFIRGYFDGDGSAHSRPGLSFAGKKEFLEWIRCVFVVAGTSKEDATIYKHTTADIYYLNYPSRIQAVPIAQTMYESATTYLERKKAKVDSW